MNDDINYFSKSFRAVVFDNDVKVYNEKTSVTIDQAISFDSEKDKFTSIDLFVSSIVSEILLTMINLAKKRGEILQDIEAKADLEILNPMYLLNVIGYEDPGIIEKLEIDIYFFSFLGDKELDDFLNEVLKRTLIYNTFQDKIKVNFKTVL
ncbi:OsmC family peroxiredoxin [Anaerococcus sp.]|uniref:OsmC family protein n=1 Tax=Anaerococcus sp. TaxID=1872515 RepID=UPI00290153E0|nr:OsmC family peroxiredoxin [Anaerococcus sp.]MDU2598650.1 OsmC family peroxiredoxin [Anaerococcus sp.]